MQALVLAAGYSTRMGSAGANPKHLLEVKPNTTVIELTIEKIIKCKDIEDTYIITNNKFYSKFCSWIKKSKLKEYNKKIKIINNGTNNNEERLGAVGDIICGLEKIRNIKNISEGLLVAQGDDIIHNLSIDEFLKEYKERRATIIIAHRISIQELAGRFGVIEIDNNKKVVEGQEKPKLEEIKSKDGTALANGGLYVFIEKDLDSIYEYKKEKIGSEKKPLDGTGRLFTWMAEKNMPFFVYEYPREYWWDVGKPEDLKSVKKFYQNL